MTTYKVKTPDGWEYIDNQNYDSRYVLASSKGSNSGVASLDSSGHLVFDQLPSSIAGAVSYQGTFDPSGEVAPTPAAQGYYYVSSGVGTVSAVSFATGDWLVYRNGTNWDKISNSSSSVTWSNITDTPASFTPDTHNNDSHSVVYITSSGVTYEALNANGDVGDEANQVASGIHVHTDYQPLDGDLTAIAALSGTAGLIRKTAANTYTLDTNTYLTELTTAPNATLWDSQALPILAGNALKVLRLNSSATALEFATSESGVTTFTELTDAPSSYTGQEGLFVKVNGTADALEFASVVTIPTWGSITGDINLQGDLNLALAGKVSIDAQAYDSARLGGIDANMFSTTGHNHDATYLGLTAKAADSNLLDGLDSTAFATTAHTHTGTYQPLDDELTLLSALSRTGNESKYIRLNATADAFEFASVTSGDSLPSQTGNSGKYLTTDGTDASWATIPTTNTFNVQRSIEGVVYETTLMYWVAPATCTINAVSMALSANCTATGSYCKVQVMKNGLLETNSIFSADTPMQITETTSATNSIYQASGTLDSNQTTLATGDVIQFRVNQADTGSADLLITLVCSVTTSAASLNGGDA